MSEKEKALAIVKKAKADLESGKISRRDFSFIMMSFGALAGYTFFSSPANAWIATRMRKSGGACRTVDKCDIFGDGSGKALYRMDGNGNDESGNYHGTETAITYGGGVYERGAVFDGSTSKVTSSLPSMGVTNSCSAWFKPNSVGGAIIVGYSNGTNMHAIYFNSTTIQFRVNGTWYVYNTSIVIGVLYHIAISVSSSIPTMYVNGALVATTTSAGTAIAQASTLEIGVGSTGSNIYYNGLIDQVRIFNRAITPAEVARLYAECAPTSIVNNANPFQDGSCKAMYKFDGNVTDATGTYNGTATAVTYAAGKFGQCAVFNGSTSRVAVSVPKKSVSFWIKTTQTTAGWILNTTESANYLHLAINNNTTNALGFSTFNSDVYGISPNPINDGNWHHVYAEYGTTKAELKIAVDGVFRTLAQSIGTTPATGLINSSITHIGNRSTDTTQLNGSLDQLRIFNKALTPMEVACLYCETTPLEEPLHSLVDPFKDGSGKALYRLEGNALDESGNYNGTPTSITYGAGNVGRSATSTAGKIQLPTATLVPSALSYSFSCLVKKNTSTQWNAMFSRDNSASNRGDGLYFDTTAKTFLVAFAKAVGTIENHSSLATTLLDDNQFHQVTLTVDRTLAVFALYLDGALFFTESFTQANSYDNGISVSLISSANATYAGTLDQVRFFNRVLTIAEITQLYNNQA